MRCCPSNVMEFLPVLKVFLKIYGLEYKGVANGMKIIIYNEILLFCIWILRHLSKFDNVFLHLIDIWFCFKCDISNSIMRDFKLLLSNNVLYVNKKKLQLKIFPTLAF